MPGIRETRRLPYSAEQMFDLVADVPSYPEFLPLCAGASSNEVDGATLATVEMSVAGLKKSFTTRNTNTRPGRIELELVDGPFSELEGTWIFENLGDDGSKVSLELEFEFGSRLLAAAVGPVFEKLSNSMIDAFTERAGVVYGGQG